MEKLKIMITKSRTQKAVKLSIYCLTFTTLLTLGGCNKDEKTPDCGCDSPTTKTIPEKANLIGKISYHKQLDPKDNYYDNMYWIEYTEPNCGNCVHSMIVCNQELLTNFKDLQALPVGQSVLVKFAGNLKETCKKRFAPADYTYDHIVLTKIERQ